MLRLGLIAALMALPADIAVTVAEPGAFAESITSTADGTLIIGSTATGAIHRRRPGAAKAERWIAPGATNGAPAPAVFGVLADTARGDLWACQVQQPPGKGGTALARYNLRDGTLRATFAFAGTGLCNDIAIDRRGTVYATDITNGRVVVLPSGAAAKGGAVRDWVADPVLKGVDGIVVHRDRQIIVNSISSGKLFAIPIGKDGAAGPIREIALSRPLARPDGMRLDGRDSLLVVEGAGRLARVHLDSVPARVETLGEGLVEPAGVTVVGRTAYVVQGHFSYLFNPALKGKAPPPTGIYAIPIPR